MKFKTKAQASLEMVVGLIILLVVAGVVIGLVLYFIKPDFLNSFSGGVDQSKFKTECQDYCTNQLYQSFCSHYWQDTKKNAVMDWDGDKQVNKPIDFGSYTTCESRIYCFLVTPCPGLGSGGIDTMQTCRDLLCQDFTSKYGDVATATKQLKKLIDVATACPGAKTDITWRWYTWGFANTTNWCQQSY